MISLWHNFQYYDPRSARTNFTFDEFNPPLGRLGITANGHPAFTRSFSGGRLENDQRFSDTDVNEVFLSRNTITKVSLLNIAPLRY